MAATWPLEGRHQELARIDRALREPEVRALVLAGAAGVGKTRLASEALLVAAARGFATVRVQATRSAATVALGALAPLLAPLAEPRDQAIDVLTWARSSVARFGGDQPLVLLVDDAHLLDDASAGVTWQLAESGEAFVIVTVRTDEPVPDRIVALWKKDVGERVEVRPLDLDAVGELLCMVLGARVEARTRLVLFQRSGGNPLYLRELVTATLERGVLRREGDEWRVAEGLVLSERLIELVTARIGSLGSAEQHALELVSFGEPMPVASLRSADASALAELERRSLVTISQDGRRLVAALAHPLYGEVVRSRARQLAARAVCRELADIVERTGGRRREDPLRFAQWRLEGGGTAGPELMLRAAQTARQYGEVVLARRLAAAAVDAGAGFDGELLTVQLRMLEGDAEGAETEFDRLSARADTDEQRAAVATSRITNLLVGLTRPEQARRVAEESASKISDAGLRDELAAVQAQLLYHLGRSGEALAVVEPVLGRVEGRALVDLGSTAAMSLIDAGRLSCAAELARRAHRAHLALEGPPTSFGPHVHSVSQAVALAHAGGLLDAEELARHGYAEAVAAGSVEAQAAFAQLLGWILIVRGLASDGARHLKESLALYSERGWKAYVMFALANLAHAEALRGDAGAAATALSALDDLHIPESHQLGHPLVLQARAWVAAADGSLAAARRHLVEGVASARASQSLVLEAALLHDLARLGAPGEVEGRLAEVAATVEGDLVKARAEYAAALRAADAARLEVVSRTFERLGAWLFAAEAAAGAAVALRRAGNRRRSTILERTTAALVRRCEGAVTPAVRNIETQAILTARELEVASLAAAGLPNRAIADRLSVSVRTVESQLQHIYEKLGVSRRGDLSEALDGS